MRIKRKYVMLSLCLLYVNIQDGDTALIMAAFRGHDAIVGLLLTYLGINVNMQNIRVPQTLTLLVSVYVNH